MARSNQHVDAFTAIPLRQRRAFEVVILQVREAITNGRLGVGDRLPHERELAGLFKVSRQSVREGLRMLEAFGVLSARRGVGPDSGWTVLRGDTTGLSVMLDLYTSLQRIPIWDLLEIRESLEMLSVRSAATRATPEEAASLIAAAQAMDELTDADSFLRADTEFHVSIARSSGNSLAPLFMEAIRDAMARAMLAASVSLPDWASERKTLVCEHLKIATEIRDGAGDAAAASVSHHIRGFYGRALREPGAAKLERMAG